MFRRSKIFSSLILVFSIVLTLTNCSPQASQAKTMTIAVVESAPGTLTSPDPQSIYAGVKLAVDQINTRQGFNLKVDLYDDQNDPTQALEIAKKIASSNAVAVIGHSSIETSDAAADVYDQNGIP